VTAPLLPLGSPVVHVDRGWTGKIVGVFASSRRWPYTVAWNQPNGKTLIAHEDDSVLVLDEDGRR
jgi:hypothetical protein